MNNKEESKEQRAGTRDLRATWSVISGFPEFRVSGNGSMGLIVHSALRNSTQCSSDHTSLTDPLLLNKFYFPNAFSGLINL